MGNYISPTKAKALYGANNVNMVTGKRDTVEVPHKPLPRLEAFSTDEAGQLGATAVSQTVEKPEQ